MRCRGLPATEAVGEIRLGVSGLTNTSFEVWLRAYKMWGILPPIARSRARSGAQTPTRSCHAHCAMRGRRKISGLTQAAGVDGFFCKLDGPLRRRRIGRGRGLVEHRGRNGNPDFLAVQFADVRAPSIRVALKSVDHVGLVGDAAHGRLLHRT